MKLVWQLVGLSLIVLAVVAVVYFVIAALAVPTPVLNTH